VFTDIARENNLQVLADLRAIVRDPKYHPETPEDICNKILYTCYMKSQFSSQETQSKALMISKEINSNHRDISFHKVYESFVELSK